MLNPEVLDTTPAHEAERKRFYWRLFCWGIVFWVLAWACFILVDHTTWVHLKSWPEITIQTGAGAVSLSVSQTATATYNGIEFEKPSFLWDEYRWLRLHPEDCLGVVARAGWTTNAYQKSFSFPVAGFLWLWLLAGWFHSFKGMRGMFCLRNRCLVGKTAILVSLPLLIVLADYRWRRLHEAAGCQLNVRNIQQAMRAHSGMRGLHFGKPIHWSELIGHGKFLPEQSRYCPCGHSYRFKSYSTAVGELYAECPNPDHRRRLHEQGTSEW